MTYLITGATSFLGVEVAKTLINQVHQVTAICRQGSYGLKNLPSDVRVVYAEMNEYGSLDKKIDNADVFIHLAWAGTGHDGRDDEEVQRQNIECTRLSLRQLSYAYDLFAPKAYKVMVDIDEAEMHKPTLSIDLPIHADLSNAIDILLQKTEGRSFDFANWKQWGREIEKQLPSLFDDNPDMPGYTNSDKFADELFKQLNSGDVVVTGNGTAYTCTYQAMKVKEGVRVFANQGSAAMGYDLPAAIGAVTANENGRTILVTGDGSLQMNIQELQTLITYKMPLKIFVLENESYLAIKTTQKAFFGGHFTGSNPASGVVCPNLEKIASAYGIPYLSISENGEKLQQVIADTLATAGPVICEVHMHPEQTLFPKSASFIDKQTGKMTSAPLEKMAPFMSDVLQEKCEYKRGR